MGPLILWLLLAILAVATIAIYNSLVQLRNEVRNGWSQIDVQLKRRHDLVPNLVETVKGYALHESETLENVTRARNQAVGTEGVAAQGAAEAGLTAALSRFMMIVEQYPELRANENFLRLQEELSATENRIGFARQFYNDAVMRYNTRTQSFPGNIVAGFFRFVEERFFEIADPGERRVPQVQF